MLASVLIVIVWPAAIYLKWKEMFPDPDMVRGDIERKFAVEMKHLMERLSVQEIEQREMVEDPLQAVPALPFGHLYDVWARFINDLPERAEVWSFSATWKNRWEEIELRHGYVTVQDGKPEAHMLTFRKPIEEDA